MEDPDPVPALWGGGCPVSILRLVVPVSGEIKLDEGKSQCDSTPEVDDQVTSLGFGTSAEPPGLQGMNLVGAETEEPKDALLEPPVADSAPIREEEAARRDEVEQPVD